MQAKILINKEGKKFFIEDIKKDFHTAYGFIKKADLKKKSGAVVKTNKGEEFTILNADFLDYYKKIKRRAQIIILRDVGAIIANTGITKESIVLDAGSGSGALALFLSKIAKQVISYEIRDEHHEIVKKNIDFLGAKNIKLKGDVYKKIDEKDIDVIVLDLPEPWKAVKNAKKALKPGGFLVNYSPCINSVMNFMDEIRKQDCFIAIKTIELQEIGWKVEEKAVRPVSKGIGHTGFLSFLRRIK